MVEQKIQPCFDLILCARTANSYNPISIDEFLSIPLNERILLIKAKRVQFFDGEKEVACLRRTQKYLTNAVNTQAPGNDRDPIVSFETALISSTSSRKLRALHFATAAA